MLLRHTCLCLLLAAGTLTALIQSSWNADTGMTAPPHLTAMISAGYEAVSPTAIA